jgi:hypothetical protein
LEHGVFVTTVGAAVNANASDGRSKDKRIESFIIVKSICDAIIKDIQKRERERRCFLRWLLKNVVVVNARMMLKLLTLLRAQWREPFHS